MSKVAMLLSAALLLTGCATTERQLMPTPSLYREPGGQPVFNPQSDARPSKDVDLLYITDRAPEKAPEINPPYGQERGTRIVFGSAQVRMVPRLDWDTLREQSQLAKRTRDIWSSGRSVS